MSEKHPVSLPLIQEDYANSMCEYIVGITKQMHWYVCMYLQLGGVIT